MPVCVMVDGGGLRPLDHGILRVLAVNIFRVKLMVFFVVVACSKIDLTEPRGPIRLLRISCLTFPCFIPDIWGVEKSLSSWPLVEEPVWWQDKGASMVERGVPCLRRRRRGCSASHGSSDDADSTHTYLQCLFDPHYPCCLISTTSVLHRYTVCPTLHFPLSSTLPD